MDTSVLIVTLVVLTTVLISDLGRPRPPRSGPAGPGRRPRAGRLTSPHQPERPAAGGALRRSSGNVLGTFGT